jgi:hypothetical protein
VLDRLYTAQAARGAHRLEIVLVLRCREAKATKHYGLEMPRLLMYHDANNIVKMKTTMTALMAKFGITTIPALVLLDEHGQVICTEGSEMCGADPKGLAFPWRDQPRVGPMARTVVNFDLPPAKRTQRPDSPARILPASRSPSENLVGKQDPIAAVSTGGLGGRGGGLAGHPIPPASARMTAAPDMDLPQSFLSSRAEETRGDRAMEVANVHAWASNRRVKQKLDPPNIVAAELPLDKPNLQFAPETIPQGELTSLMQPQPLPEVHPFAPTLRKWQQGILVDCGPDWARSVIEAAVERGPHPMACTPDLIALFAEDIEYQIKACFCRVFFWEDLKQHLPANFKISPVAVVPQVGRWGQIILNLLFPVYQDINGMITMTQESVNDSTILAALPEAVKEIRKVFPRLLQYMRDTSEGLHILFSKLDISNGFWHLVEREADNFNFAYVLLQRAGEPVRIVVPSAVQMGWVESPPLFCAVTESAQDLTQHLVDNKVDLPLHPLEDKISIKDVPMQARTATPTKLLQVYVDNFCNAATQ